VTCRVRCGQVALKIELTPRWRARSLQAAVLKPFVGAFNKRSAGMEQPLTIQLLQRATLDGKPFELARAMDVVSGEIFTRAEHRLELFLARTDDTTSDEEVPALEDNVGNAVGESGLAFEEQPAERTGGGQVIGLADVTDSAGLLDDLPLVQELAKSTPELANLADIGGKETTRAAARCACTLRVPRARCSIRSRTSRFTRTRWRTFATASRATRASSPSGHRTLLP
jgi:hypothetical protein